MNGVNALLVKEKDGQLTVHSLSLTDLGMVLFYDPSLAREPVERCARPSYGASDVGQKTRSGFEKLDQNAGTRAG